MDDTTSLLLQRVAVLRSHLKSEISLPNAETIQTLITDLERAIEQGRADEAILARENSVLLNQNRELVRKNDLLIRQKEILDRQNQNLERQVKTLERHNTNLLRQNSRVERHNAALEESRMAIEIERSRYRDLFEFTPDAVLISDTTGVIQTANRAAAVMLKTPQRELKGESLLTFVAAEHQKLFMTLLTHLQHMQDIELCIQPRGMPELETAVTLSTLNNDTGKPALLHWIVRDITERRRAMTALNASERRFRTIFNEANIGILLLDVDGKIVRANRAIQETLGYGEDELYNRHIQDLSCPDDPPLANVGLMLRENRQGAFNLENRFRRRDGQYIWTNLSFSGMYGEQGQLLYLIGMVKDVTAEKLSAAELTEMRRRLLESGEVERLRLAQQLHDGPTQDVYSTVFMMSTFPEADGQPELKSSLHDLQEMLKRVASTLRDIVGELRPPTIGNLGLDGAIRSHADKVREHHPELEIKLHLTRDGQKLPAHTRLAFFRIYQECLANILRHAQATQAVIAVHVDDSDVTLDIWDNGKGFYPPRKWVDLLRQGHYGLAGISERVHALGGKFKVESRPGSGTLVHVIAPIEIE